MKEEKDKDQEALIIEAVMELAERKEQKEMAVSFCLLSKLLRKNPEIPWYAWNYALQNIQELMVNGDWRY